MSFVRTKQEGHAARMGVIRNVGKKKFFSQNLKRTGSLENLDNIKTHLKEIGCEAGDCGSILRQILGPRNSIN